MRIPTVRVKHPSGEGFITINAADFDDGRHDLYWEQAEDFDPSQPRRASTAQIDPALRDAAAALMLRIVAFKRRIAGEPFAELPPAEQLAVLQAMSAEIDQAEAAYAEDQREREAFEASQRAQDAVRRQEAPQTPPAPPPPAVEPLRAGKGPRGLWYVWRGDDRVSKGYPSEPEAIAAMNSAETGGV